MARVDGKDVLLALMEQTKQLHETQTRQGELLDRTVQRMDLMSDHMRAMTDHTQRLSGQMQALTTQMQALTAQMQALTTHMRELSDDQLALRGDFVALASNNVQFGVGLRRVTDLLLTALDRSNSRFDTLETRVTKLEKKAG
ncbi:MAG: hypothetical protein U0228_35265 [Myxococcaceae bacterium]